MSQTHYCLEAHTRAPWPIRARCCEYLVTGLLARGPGPAGLENRLIQTAPRPVCVSSTGSVRFVKKTVGGCGLASAESAREGARVEVPQRAEGVGWVLTAFLYLNKN